MAILYFLSKEPEFVVDAIPEAWHMQSCERIKEARGEPAEAAIAESGVGLRLENV
jgi:hypothetical protein